MCVCPRHSGALRHLRDDVSVYIYSVGFLLLSHSSAPDMNQTPTCMLCPLCSTNPICTASSPRREHFSQKKVCSILEGVFSPVISLASMIFSQLRIPTEKQSIVLQHSPLMKLSGRGQSNHYQPWPWEEATMATGELMGKRRSQ